MKEPANSTIQQTITDKQEKKHPNDGRFHGEKPTDQPQESITHLEYERLWRDRQRNPKTNLE